MTAAAYSVATGDYSAEQLEGEACAECGNGFEPGEFSRPAGVVFDGGQLFVHVECPKGGATR